ncbi:MAG: hypothetical protein ACI88G_000168 [Woeseiaceae bacterium]|jgi:hypothetical protein
MGTEYTEINEKIQSWIEGQRVFFVSTAPMSGDGLINCSPKGLDCFRVLGPTEIGYVDTGGSGIETVSHLRENGRIVIMMCAFDGPPKIFRFYGKGTALEPHDEMFSETLARFPQQPAARNIILIDVQRIMDSCGFGVPLFEFQKDRDSLSNYFANKSEEEILAYRAERNRVSLDGLPGLQLPDEE